MSSLRLSPSEIRYQQLLNCLKALAKQGLISESDLEKTVSTFDLKADQYMLPVEHRRAILGIPESLITKTPAVFITFLSNLNIVNQSSGDELLKTANQHDEYQPVLHVWVLDREQKTANSLRAFFRIDKSRKKVDNISGGQIERTKRGMDQRILIYTWFGLHGDYFSHYHAPEIVQVIRRESWDNISDDEHHDRHPSSKDHHPTSKDHQIISIHDRLSMLLNLRFGDVVITRRDSDMAGKAITSRMVK